MKEKIISIILVVIVLVLSITRVVSDIIHQSYSKLVFHIFLVLFLAVVLRLVIKKYCSK